MTRPCWTRKQHAEIAKTTNACLHSLNTLDPVGDSSAFERNESLRRLYTATIMRYTPCRSEHEFKRDTFYPVNRPEVSFPPLVSQHELCDPPTLRVTEPLSLGSDVGLGKEECNIIIDDFLVSKISLSLPCHPIRVRLPVKGTWDYPTTSSQSPQAPSHPHSCSIGTAASPHVQSPRESLMPSTKSNSSTALPVSRPHPLKDLVNELPPFPFPHSLLTDFLGKLESSVTYEDLLTGAKAVQSRPLRLRRRKVRGACLLEKFPRELMFALSTGRAGPTFSPSRMKKGWFPLFATSTRTFIPCNLMSCRI